ncbi:MAG: hypothetical protein QW520_07980 [Methanomassiliicoccales archaeon]
MIEKKYLKASIIILLAFSIGLIGFYIFSVDKPDGLEAVMEENGLEEGEPVWNAPLDYGSSYLSTLLMGFLGFLIVFLSLLGYLWMVKKTKAKGS